MLISLRLALFAAAGFPASQAAPLTLRGRQVTIKNIGRTNGDAYSNTQRGHSDLVNPRGDHEHVYIYEDDDRRHHYHDYEIINEHNHVHKRTPAPYHHHAYTGGDIEIITGDFLHHGHTDEHIHAHIHQRDHDDHHRHHHHHHHHDKRSHHHRRPIYVHSPGNHPILSLDLYDDEIRGIHARAAAGLLDPVADLLAPVAPLVQALVPVLKGLPLVGGVIDVLGSTLAGIGGPKIGALLTGKPLTAAFVSDASSAPVNFAYQIDAASSGTPTPMFLAQLPFQFPDAGCANMKMPVPVSIAIPVMGNSSLQVLCATYTSLPETASMLTAEPCGNMSAADTMPTGANMSQVFAWSADTGVIHPLWNSTASAMMNCSGGLMPSSAVATANSTAGAAQSVLLVFTESPMPTNDTDTSSFMSNSTSTNWSMSDSNSTIPDESDTPDSSMNSTNPSNSTVLTSLTFGDGTNDTVYTGSDNNYDAGSDGNADPTSSDDGDDDAADSSYGSSE